MSEHGTLTINGQIVRATHFAYDGCHKIYLIDNAAARSEMAGCGYGGDDILPVSELARVWEQTCPLRFIHWADLRRPDVVPQAYEDEPVIEWIAA